MRVLLDADGVVADLMGGYCRWLNRECGSSLTVDQIRTHSSKVAPEIQWGTDEDNRLCRERFGKSVRGMVHPFMDLPDVYSLIDLIPGAQAGVQRLQSELNEVLFVTSIGKFHNSYASKVAWLYDRFPGCRVVAISSDIKHYMVGDVFVDDRADTCLRAFYGGNIRRTFVFQQPWSYNPELPEHQVQSLVEVVERHRSTAGAGIHIAGKSKDDEPSWQWGHLAWRISEDK